MIEPVIPEGQPYPGRDPWRDVSECLTPGLSPFREGSVVARADGNDLKFSWVISVDRQHPDLEDNWLVRGVRLPVGLRPAATAAATGWFSVSGNESPLRVEFTASGLVAMPRFPSMGLQLADFSLIDLTATVPRGAL